jgi:hypothetical protein
MPHHLMSYFIVVRAAQREAAMTHCPQTIWQDMAMVSKTYSFFFIEGGLTPPDALPILSVLPICWPGS